MKQIKSPKLYGGFWEFKCAYLILSLVLALLLNTSAQFTLLRIICLVFYSINFRNLSHKAVPLNHNWKKKILFIRMGKVVYYRLNKTNTLFEVFLQCTVIFSCCTLLRDQLICWPFIHKWYLHASPVAMFNTENKYVKSIVAYNLTFNVPKSWFP